MEHDEENVPVARRAERPLASLNRDVLSASIFSIECHEAALGAKKGRHAEADALFTRATAQFDACVEALQREQQEEEAEAAGGVVGAEGTTPQHPTASPLYSSPLLTVQVMHARALRLQASEHESRGRAEAAATASALADRLDSAYGFTSSLGSWGPGCR